MAFAHDTEVSLQAAAAVVNSGLPPLGLATVPQLDAFFVDFGYTGRHDRDDDELAAVQGLRPRLRALLLAERDEAVDLVNSVLARAGALPRLVRHDASDWHIHAVDDDAPLDVRILVETAMAMVDLIRADDLSRIGVCADDDCDGVVVDLSRNRSRRFCSTTCTNRNAAAAYRARRTGD